MRLFLLLLVVWFVAGCAGPSHSFTGIPGRSLGLRDSVADAWDAASAPSN